jgi:hypothetical protein
MIKVIKIVLVCVIVAMVGLVGFAMTKPDSLHVERSSTIKAPPEKVFPLINDFHNWGSWSPYEKKDPGMKRTYSGAPSGKGAIYEWDGNGDVGQGRMEILNASPSEVRIKLDFMKPLEGHDIALFTMKPDAGGTTITWAMDGPTPLLGKIIGVFMNMDTMLGADFETGLSNLRALAEK